MKALKCELCGGNDFIKDEEFFVCQHCQTKYTPEAARKLMIEGVVEVTGTVQVDRTNEIENLLINAHRAFQDKNYEEAIALYLGVLNIDPNNATAILYRGLATSWTGSLEQPRIADAVKAYERAVSIEHGLRGDSSEFFRFVLNAETAMNSLFLAKSIMYVNNYRYANATAASDFSGIRLHAMNLMEQYSSYLASTALWMVGLVFNLVNDFTQADDYFHNFQKSIVDSSAKFLVESSQTALAYQMLGERNKFYIMINDARQQKYWRENPEAYQRHLQVQAQLKSLKQELAKLEHEKDSIKALDFSGRKTITQRTKIIRSEIDRIERALLKP